MSTTRREFLVAVSAAAAYPLMAGQTAAAATPTLGLIFPPENYPIPADAKMLFPSGVEFIGNGVGLPGGMTVQGYEEAVPRILPRAAELAQKGANVISVFGSSITFYKGAKFHDDLITQVEKATGRKATTQSNGLLDGLRTANARRVAIATAYTDEVTERLQVNKVMLREVGQERANRRLWQAFGDDLMEIVDSNETGERFPLGMVRGLRTGDLAAFGRLIQQIREHMRTVDHVDQAVANVKHGAGAHRDEVQEAGMEHGGYQRGAHTFFQSQVERGFDDALISLAGAALERGRNALFGCLARIGVEDRAHRGLAGDIAVLHAAHAVTEDGEVASMSQEGVVLRIRQT